MRLRHAVIGCALAVFVAGGIFGSSPAAALADSALGAHEPFNWGYLPLILIPVLVMLIIVTAVFVLLLSGARWRDRRRELRERQEIESSTRREQEFIRELEEREHERRALGEPKAKAGPWAGS